MFIEATAVLVLLSLPAAIRAVRIARFHRQLGPRAWQFIIAADGLSGLLRQQEGAALMPEIIRDVGGRFVWGRPTSMSAGG
jgi:hypothetical protein